MGNTELYIIDQAIEDLEQDSTFVIDTDEKAEWAIKKIAEERAEAARIISVCQDSIRRYNDTIKKTEDTLESKTGYLTFQLQRYMETVKSKESKTQKTYKLPSGTLKIKYQAREFKRDDEKLTAYLMQNNYTDYIETKFKPKWAELKKNVVVQDGKAIIEDTGDVIEGVAVIEREDKFEVEI